MSASIVLFFSHARCYIDHSFCRRFQALRVFTNKDRCFASICVYLYFVKNRRFPKSVFSSSFVFSLSCPLVSPIFFFLMVVSISARKNRHGNLVCSYPKSLSSYLFSCFQRVGSHTGFHQNCQVLLQYGHTRTHSNLHIFAS